MVDVISVKSRTKSPEVATQTLARALVGRAVGFRDCPAQTLDKLVASGQMRDYGKGECVARRGESFSYLGMLIKGSLESTITRADGHRHLIGLLQPGDIVGLVPVFDGLGHVNDLWTRVPSTLLLVPADVVRKLRATEPLLVQALERHLAFRCRLLYERLASDPALPLDARVAALLQTLNTLYGLPRDRGAVLDMKLSQFDLADWLGVSRQRINFVVKQLEADGVISLQYSAVTIVDLAKLAKRAQNTRPPRIEG